MLKITDISQVCKIAKSKGILVGCDNTWTTPLIQRPIELGADLVFHSSTKFFGGHSDVLGGVIIIKKKNELAAKIREYQIVGGSVPSPFDCWLLNRSLATLSLRLERQIKNAAAIAVFLKSQPLIEQVYYPGLPDHPNHEIAKQQMHGQALQFAGSMKLFKHATSLGGVESLIEHRRSAEGSAPRSPANLLRLSIGVEYIDDLIGDLGMGFEKLR
jgi:cystathionine gamma-synthase